MLAELERELINERAAVAWQAARARGKYAGQPRALAPDKVALARAWRADEMMAAQVAQRLGVPRATLYRSLAD